MEGWDLEKNSNDVFFKGNFEFSNNFAISLPK